MAALYQIEQDMLSIYDKIEQQGGEILPEDEQALMVTREDFKDKLSGYNNYMNELSHNIDACKQEEARVKALRKAYEGRLDTTKKVVLNAVQQFGTQTKSGGWAIEFPTFKFSTRRSEYVVADELRMHYLDIELRRLLRELYTNSMLNPNIEWDMQGLCDTLNANIKAMMEDENVGDKYLPITPMDLELIEITVESSCSIANMFRVDNGIAPLLPKGGALKAELSLNKVTAKEYLKATEDANIISCCHKEANYSLQMK